MYSELSGYNSNAYTRWTELYEAVSNLQGRFLNKYIDKNGNTKQVEITGSLKGSVDFAVFVTSIESGEVMILDVEGADLACIQIKYR